MSLSKKRSNVPSETAKPEGSIKQSTAGKVAQSQ